ncbi:hypothetical protein [Ruminococcus flavefaciens]|uniref:(H+)-ATPase G subunit n=1 Tax=Ruminococcus flavefaciens TaxID=1265 RepID=A0A315Y5J0_RUMFL|nr:hypothetical protein [Ruminococcus flavefaciens]PWJ15258.1 (H+)-ATPase G subunit [Ruminococcus flavefaciens]SSA40304.1 (H+)-ATPase G subunit [Ruminococcus flavefaciens]
MASEAVKKILEAEALSEKKNAEARRRREDIISSASGSSSLAIQKKISEAASEVSKLRQTYSSKLESYKHNAEAECQNKISEIKKLAGSNTDKAVDEIIRRFF